jgi:hypothetical protein
MRVAVAMVTHGYATEGCNGETLPNDVFTSVLSRSPEMGAVNDAPNAGADVRGAVSGSFHLIRLTTPGKLKNRWHFRR